MPLDISEIVMMLENPLSPKSALKRHEHILPNLNREELMTHENIYFVGIENNPDKGPNDKTVTGSCVPHSHVDYRYEIQEIIGQGGFGEVYRAFDHKDKRLVALKMMQHEHGLKSQAVNEVTMLRGLNRLDTDKSGNTLQIYRTFYFGNRVCVTMELLNRSLSKYIKTNNCKGSDLQTVNKLACSILRGLSFLHQHGIVHGDLKPGNIMLSQPDGHDVKLIDFGTSFYARKGPGYDCFGTSCYRAPEVLTGAKCGTPLDMWSFGCTVAELFTGQFLFKETNRFKQFDAFVEVLGLPPGKLFLGSKKYSLFFDSNGCPRHLTSAGKDAGACSKRGPPNSKPLSSLLENSNSPQFIDFVSSCLEWKPHRRLHAWQALDHAWITGVAALPVVKTKENEESK